MSRTYRASKNTRRPSKASEDLLTPEVLAETETASRQLKERRPATRREDREHRMPERAIPYDNRETR